MTINIPDEILRSAQVSEDDLKLEIALLLYKQNKISSGKVRAWLGLTVLEFQHELAKRCFRFRTRSRKFVVAVKPFMDKLIEQANFRISEVLYQTVLKLAQE